MLIPECSQGCYAVTDGSVTISLRNFVGEGIIRLLAINAFKLRQQNGHCRYKYIVLWRDRSYFVLKKRKHSDFTKHFSETDIINMIEIFIDNIFAMFGGQSVYIYGCKMCSSSRRFVLLLAWFWLHTGASQEKRKVFFHWLILGLVILLSHLCHWAWNKGYHR